MADLSEIRDACGIMYLYTLRTDGKNVTYIVDTDDIESHCQLGEQFELSQKDWEVKGSWKNSELSNNIISITEETNLLALNASSTGYTRTEYYQRPSGQSYNGQKIYDDYKRIYTTYIVYDKCRTCGYVVNSRYFEECTYDGRAY